MKASAAARQRALRDFESTRAIKSGAPPDELRFPRGELSFTKALPHLASGRVDPEAYSRLLRALRSGERRDFEKIPLGGFAKLAEPEAAFELAISGPEAVQLDLTPPPAAESLAGGLEMVELYWMALLRDEPFLAYASNSSAALAARELAITPPELFRGETRGDLAGPYLSQFLALDVTMHPLRFDQRFRSPVAGVDYQTTWAPWLAAQNGLLASAPTLDADRRYIRNGRDLAEYVRRDFSYQAFLNAALILLRLGGPTDGGEPNRHSRTRSSFPGFGSPLVLHLVAAVAQPALRVSWYFKWLAFRRLRPEEFGGLLERPDFGGAPACFDSNLIDSEALGRSQARHGSRLLPQAYPEGSPIHPAYPAGHAVVAGACVTVLKAFFDESFEFPEPVEATLDGLRLQPAAEVRLTVGGELDKLAANISFGRSFAGIHYRSDSTKGMLLGEQLAVAFLRELLQTAASDFQGWSLRTFSGQRIEISSSRTAPTN